MNLLNEREKTHGNFSTVALLSQEMKNSLRWVSIGGFEELTPVHQEALDMICVKMARVVCGDHNEIDHWQDIIGYAQLVLNHIKKEPPGNPVNKETPDEPTDPSIGDDWDSYYIPRSGLPR